MDGDLQDPPELLPEMVRLWSEGTDVVYGLYTSRREGVVMRLARRAFYRLLTRVAFVEIPRDACDFSVMDRRVVDLIVAMGECHRYVRGLRSWVGFRQVAFPYVRDVRHTGAPKYTLSKLMDLALTGIVSFSYAPLRLAALVGAGISLVAFATALFYLVQRLAGFRVFGHSPEDVPGFTSVFVLMAFLFGVQLLMLGVLGEYVGRIFEEVKRRPVFVVDELVGLDPVRATGIRGPGRA
jgi:dolichol-phosphate mannosyltransferase